MEKYVTIPSYPNYQIYDDGTVIRMEHVTQKGANASRKPIKASKMANGYYTVVLRNNEGKKKVFYLHRLIWEAFYGEIPAGMEIDHIDTNKANCQLSNLLLVSHSQNCKNPISLENYKIANALDKHKYDKERLLRARTKEYQDNAVKVYYFLLNRDGTVKIETYMNEAHIGFYRAKRLMNQLSNEITN